jgi:hypothetical protein
MNQSMQLFTLTSIPKCRSLFGCDSNQQQQDRFCRVPEGLASLSRGECQFVEAAAGAASTGSTPIRAQSDHTADAPGSPEFPAWNLEGFCIRRIGRSGIPRSGLSHPAFPASAILCSHSGINRTERSTMADALIGNKQVILAVGGEGGDIKLIGMETAAGWMFHAETDSSGLSALLDDEEDRYVPPERPWVASWAEAIDQLDQYPWAYLFPTSAHIEFRGQIKAALAERLTPSDREEWDRWGAVLQGS